jgi:branched-chain amino acid transport system permease protein
MPQLMFILGQTTLPTGFEKFLAAVIDGLALGSIYALIGLGFVLIFKATQVLNFAQGALAAVGAYFVAYFVGILDIPGRWLPESIPPLLSWSLSVFLAVIAAAIVGIIIERLFIRPMIGEPLFSIAIITLGIDIMLRSLLDNMIGTGIRPLNHPFGINVFTFGNIRVPHAQIATFVVALALLVVVVAFFRTKLGVAMRATAFDQEAAMAQGISIGRIFAAAWAIGAGLAAIAGVFASVEPRATGVSVATAFLVFRAFPAVVIGGLDSIGGAVLGGFMIGLAQVLAGVYLEANFDFLGAGFATIVPYLLMMLVLLWRPYGIFGTEEIRRV